MQFELDCAIFVINFYNFVYSNICDVYLLTVYFIYCWCLTIILVIQAVIGWGVGMTVNG
jgi:hypothetical protein